MASKRVREILIRKRAPFTDRELEDMPDGYGWGWIMSHKKPDPNAPPEICFTGFKDKEREVLERNARKMFIVRKSVTKHLSFLIAGEWAGPAKLHEATLRNIDILTLDEFKVMLRDGVVPEHPSIQEHHHDPESEQEPEPETTQKQQSDITADTIPFDHPVLLLPAPQSSWPLIAASLLLAITVGVISYLAITQRPRSESTPPAPITNTEPPERSPSDANLTQRTAMPDSAARVSDMQPANEQTHVESRDSEVREPTPTLRRTSMPMPPPDPHPLKP